MKICIICGKDLETSEAEVCNTCFEVLKQKYPKKRKLREVIEWHKDNLEDVDEEQACY